MARNKLTSIIFNSFKKAAGFCGLFCLVFALYLSAGAMQVHAKTQACDAPVKQVIHEVKGKKITAKTIAKAVDAVSPQEVSGKFGASKEKRYRYLAKAARFYQKKMGKKSQRIKILSRKPCSKKSLKRLGRPYKKLFQIEKAKWLTVGNKKGKITVAVIKVHGRWYLDRLDAEHQVKNANRVLKYMRF